MATLYVTEQGARLEKEYRRLLVTKDDKVLLVTPLARLSEVVLVGRVGATTPALLALLDAGVGLTFINRSGTLRGRLAPPTGKNIPLRHAQYDRARDPAFCLAVSRAIVAGKLRNSRTMARRMLRARAGRESEAVAAITASLKAVPAAPDIPALMGLEGAAARAYFRVLKAALPPELNFTARRRRPPPDPANALLSLGYTLLANNLITACEVVGLDPYDGFFHADKYGRPALALDLMEEFRPLVVDSVVQTLFNKRMLTAADFQPGRGGGVYLSSRGRRVFFKQYSRRLQTEATHPRLRRRLSYQRLFEVQARLLAKTIQGEISAYSPFLIK